MDMRERIARALAAIVMSDDGSCTLASDLDFCGYEDHIQDKLLLIADTALEAMREPDEAMLAAALNSEGRDRDSFHTEIDVIWRDMIDAAKLTETQELSA